MQYEADSIHGGQRSFHTKSLKSLVRFDICEENYTILKLNTTSSVISRLFRTDAQLTSW